MSVNYAFAQVNTSLERIVLWYREFMHRTEQSFKALHQRIVYLEDRQALQGPSDEQVERVLRKILAERFADAGVQQRENPNVMKDGQYFVEPSKEDGMIPTPIPIDVNTLRVDLDAMPSKRYAETLQMLEDKLPGFPAVDVRRETEDNQNAENADVKGRTSDSNSPSHQRSNNSTKRGHSFA